MPVSERTVRQFAELKPFLPRGSFRKVLTYFEEYPIFLKITRERQSLLGDYRNPTRINPVHRISINGNLNPYSFLVTLLHELAHLVTYVRCGNRVAPHGKQWQRSYAEIIKDFIGRGIFPKDIEVVLKQSLTAARASTCSDPLLYRALKAYDKRSRHFKYIEQIPEKALFQTPDGKKFKMIGKVRTRYKCRDLKTRRIYLFNPVTEVMELRNI